MSGYSAKSDEEADSWLETIARFTPEQLETLKASEMTEDNVTILCDGYWRREFFKPEAERDWDHVAQKLDGVDRTARAIQFDLLEAAAIRTRIMLLAEWQHRLDDAVALATTSLERFEGDGARFLILEVTGRQLGYAGQNEQAIDWLDRALACDAYRKSLWRRNVLVTEADLYSKHNPKKAAEFTAAAVDMAKDGVLAEPIFIETLLEHVIALWNAGEERQASDLLAEILGRLFAIKEDTESWKGLFYRTFHVLSYYSDIAQHGKVSTTYTAPEQGLFLAPPGRHVRFGSGGDRPNRRCGESREDQCGTVPVRPALGSKCAPQEFAHPPPTMGSFGHDVAPELILSPCHGGARLARRGC